MTSGLIAILVVLLVVLLMATGVVYVVHVIRERRRKRMRAVAASTGLEVDVSTKPPPPIDFDLFDAGGSKRVTAQMWRAGDQDSVFQYQYTVNSGENSTTHRYSAALISVPFSAPHLTISTENWWSKARRVIGLRDIEVESPRFNDRYHVRCDDERFAIALLDPPMIGWMLSPQSGGGVVTFEFVDRWMLCHCDQLELEVLPAMLAWACSVRAELPTVLTDLYRA